MIDNKDNLLNRWKTVRVFISSTFRDMFAERDHLVKVVFPALREKLGKYRVYLIDIDLRWGVTKEQADNDQVLDLCLDLIDECRPFFIGILGERYGWIPKKIPSEAIRKYGWVQHVTDKSLTELEILHGVLNNPEMSGHAFFYFRDPDTLSKIPDKIKEIYVESDPDLIKKLIDLKDRIRHSGHQVMDLYPAQWDAEAYDRYTKAKGRLAGLKEFGDRIQEQLWERIKEELILPDKPPTETEADPLAIEQDYHERFIDSRLNVYIGRDKIHKDLLAYLDGDDIAPLIVTGPSGSGKSAILARLSRESVQRDIDTLVIPFFIGASPSSTTIRSALQYLCNVIKKTFDLAPEAPAEADKLITTFRSFLFSIPENKRLALIIDGLNQFDEADHPEEFAWLPEELASNVKIILSCVDDLGKKQRTLERAREMKITEKRVDELTDDERVEIIKKVPSVSAKTLDNEQITMLLDNSATKIPLYLLIALEELRGFGSFEKLNHRISEFSKPDELAVKDGDIIQTIFSQVIKRLAEEFDAELVRISLSLLACARRGLSEKELQDLVVELTGKDDLFPVLRQLRSYLMKRSELIDFFHRGLKKAINSIYLKDEETKRTYHLQLADYFKKRKSDDRKVDELPWQLAQAKEWSRLKNCVTNIEIFLKLMRDEKKYELMGYWLLIDDIYDKVDAYNDSLGRFEKKVSSDDYLVSTLYMIGNFLELSARYEGAEPLFRRALSIREKILGPFHPNTATSLNNLASLLQSKGEYDEAETLFQRALAIDEVFLGPEHPGTASGLNNFAMLVQSKGEYDRAERLYRRALAIRENVIGEKHSDTAQTLGNLAALLHSKCDYAEAEIFYRRSLDIRKKVLGLEHPDTAGNLHNYASLLYALGNYERAELLSRNALAVYEKVFGPEHPNTATNLGILAALLNRKGDYNGAESLYRRALGIQEKVFGPEHPCTVLNLNNLALMLYSKGDYDSAEPLYRRALCIRKKVLGPEHPNTAQSLETLAVLLHSKGEYDEAESLYHKALDIRESILGPDHLDTARSQQNLAMLLSDKGDLNGAEPLILRSLNFIEKALGPEHHYTAAGLNNLAMLLKRKGDYESAESIFYRALGIYKKVLGADHPNTLVVANNIEILFKEKAKNMKPKSLFRSLLAILKKKK